VNTYSSSTDNLLAINCGNSCTVTTLPVDKYHTCKLFDENRASGCMDDCAGVGSNDLATLNAVFDHCGLCTCPLTVHPRHSLSSMTEVLTRDVHMGVAATVGASSGSATVKATFVVVAALAALVLNL
jgi:hypothetical protein